MYKSFFVFFILIFYSNSYAQDLIVLLKGDSVDCKIDAIKGENLYYTFKTEDGAFLSSEFKKSDLSVALFDYSHENNTYTKKKDFQNLNNVLLLSLNIGIGSRFSSSSYFNFTDEKNKNVIYFSLKPIYLFSKRDGLGVQYTSIGGTNSVDVQSIKGIEKVKIRFLGPVYYLHNKITKGNVAYNLSLSFGILNYIEKVEAPYYSVDFKGSAFGIEGGIGLGYYLSRRMSITGSVNVLIGNAINVEPDNGSLPSREENLSSYSGAISLNYYLW